MINQKWWKWMRAGLSFIFSISFARSWPHSERVFLHCEFGETERRARAEGWRPALSSFALLPHVFAFASVANQLDCARKHRANKSAHAVSQQSCALMKHGSFFSLYLLVLLMENKLVPQSVFRSRWSAGVDLQKKKMKGRLCSIEMRSSHSFISRAHTLAALCLDRATPTQ